MEGSLLYWWVWVALLTVPRQKRVLTPRVPYRIEVGTIEEDAGAEFGVLASVEGEGGSWTLEVDGAREGGEGFRVGYGTRNCEERRQEGTADVGGAGERLAEVDPYPIIDGMPARFKEQPLEGELADAGVKVALEGGERPRDRVRLEEERLGWEEVGSFPAVDDDEELGEEGLGGSWEEAASERWRGR